MSVLINMIQSIVELIFGNWKKKDIVTIEKAKETSEK